MYIFTWNYLQYNKGGQVFHFQNGYRKLNNSFLIENKFIFSKICSDICYVLYGICSPIYYLNRNPDKTLNVESLYQLGQQIFHVVMEIVSSYCEYIEMFNIH